MPVQVSLIELVCVAGTRHLWPPEFDALVNACEENPDERTPFGVVADWLEEADRGEHLLARGFRYLAKRPKVVVEASGRSWFVRGLPSAAQYADHGRVTNFSTLAGAVADVAFKLELASKELE